MAVYKHTYRGYDGVSTPAWSRFLILHRYARRTLFESKLLVAFFVACLVPALFQLIVMYVMHSSQFLAQLGIHLALGIDRTFFFDFLHTQCVMAFLFTAFAAPGLIAPDLANGALALYFARPFTRLEYLAGKFTVLFVLISELTWIPGLVLFAVACDLGGASWRAANLWLAGALVLASLIWIVTLSLLALALSAWVRWRIAAAAALLGLYFFGAGFGAMVNAALHTQNGGLLDFMQLHLIVWNGLFRLSPPPLALENEAWAVLAGLVAVSWWLLLRRVRPLEVVR